MPRTEQGRLVFGTWGMHPQPPQPPLITHLLGDPGSYFPGKISNSLLFCYF